MRCSPAYSYQKLYTHTGTLNMETFRRRRGNIFQLLGRHLKCSFVSLGPCTFLISRMAFQNVQLHTVQFPVTSRFSFRLYSSHWQISRLRKAIQLREYQLLWDGGLIWYSREIGLCTPCGSRRAWRRFSHWKILMVRFQPMTCRWRYDSLEFGRFFNNYLPQWCTTPTTRTSVAAKPAPMPVFASAPSASNYDTWISFSCFT